MCRLISTLLLLFVLLAATPARAQADCTSVDAVWDSITVIRKLQRTDTPTLRMRLRATLAPLSDNSLPRLNQFSEALESDLDGGASAQTLLATALSQNLSSGLQKISIENDCDSLPSSVLSESGSESGAEGEGGGFDRLSEAGTDPIRQTGASSVSDISEGGPQFINGVLFQGDLAVFFSMLAALIILPILVHIRRTSKSYLQREERRMLLEPVRVRVGRQEIVMTLVDISMNGFKLRHEGRIVGTPKLFVQLNGQWTAGHVRWSNEQFSGVKFHRPIDARVMDAVLNPQNVRLAV